MKHKQLLKNGAILFSLIACMLSFYGCQPQKSPGYLTIDNIEFEETLSREFIDLPDGIYTPDNPDFHPDKPETWTGNMAQYVRHIYYYDITYQISNLGDDVAYDTEIDWYYTFSIGEERVETGYLGNIESGISIIKSTSISAMDRQLVECAAEVFWYYD